MFSTVLSDPIRLSAGVPHRLARMAPKGGLQYRDWIIPEGVRISLSLRHSIINDINS